MIFDGKHKSTKYLKMEIQAIIISHIIVFHAASAIDVRARACKMIGQNVTADCSRMELTKIKTILSCLPNTILELRLNNNKIRDIPRSAFARFSFLQTLRLEHNMLEYLKSGAFEGLPNLENLCLSYNMLKHNDSYTQDVFEPLRGLRRLELQGNCDVHHTHCEYPDRALSAVHSLQYLHLDGIPNTNFGTGFTQLTQLQSLRFTGDNGYCKLPILTQNTFKSFRQTPLSYLHLDNCDIKHLAPYTFQGLSNLTTLVVLQNKNLCSNSIENATLGLNETNIETIKFNYWCRHPPYFPILAEGNFRGLRNTSLKSLDLGWNNIYYIDPTAIKNLPTSVEYMSIKENDLQTADFLKEMPRLDNLRTCDGSYQSHFGDSTAKATNRKPNIRTISPRLIHQNTVKNRNISSVLNQSFSFLAFRNVTHGDGIVQLPRNLQRLYMNNIKLGYPIPPLRFGQNKLQYLDASNCMLRAFLGTWYGLKHLQFLNISYNRIGFFHPLSLFDMGNLTSLSLQGNEIGKSLNLDTKGVTFSSLKNLTELDLSSNVIKNLPYKIFKDQFNLRKLLLADNSLRNVSFSLKSMRKLQLLDVSGNEVQYLSKENMAFLDLVAKKGYIHLDLTGNIISCMCDNQEFVNWLATTKVYIVGKDKLSCLYRNNTLVSLSRIVLIRHQLRYECSLWIVMTSCVICFVCLLLLFSLVALIYHKRWQFRYLWYIGRIQIDPFHHPGGKQALLDIDAYISYEQHYDVNNDVTLHRMITDNLYPFFEQRGYTIRIREEFDGYEKLYHAIPQAIRKSRKVVVILTPSYCEDYWNTFEFNIAAYEGIYTKRSVIIPILIGDVSEKHLTPEICAFIRSKIKSNEVLRLPIQDNFESHIKAFNEQLEQCIRQ